MQTPNKATTPPPIQRRRWWRALPSLVLLTASVPVIAILRRVDPNQPDSLLPACPLWSLTGIFCPGCGSTRCLHALIHGDIFTALSMNALLVLSLPLLLIMSLSAAGFNPAKLAGTRRIIGNPRLWLWLLLSFWLLRNLPFAPFVWLAPAA